MAYVAISGNLISNVSHKIDNLKRAEIKAIPEVSNHEKLHEAPEDLVLLVWGEHNHLRNVIPTQWTKTRDDIKLRVNWTTPEGKEDYMIYNVELGKKIVCPPDAGGYSHTVLVDESYHMMSEYVAYYKQVHDIEARWDKVQAQILQFLKGCKSLNEALKLWPDVRIYIHSEDLARVDKKVERSVASNSALDILKSIDTDGAVAAAVGARLAGAAGGSNV
jgi:hypothetical protein